MAVEIRELTAGDVPLMHAMTTLFGAVFDDASYDAAKRPSDDYLRRLLEGDSFIAAVALEEGEVIGGIAAYEMKKFEQERSEIYIYDLAVAAEYRRQGIASALIAKVKEIAAERGAWVIFVQADTAPEDEPAIALYSKLGRREEVLHFDIAVDVEDDGV